MSDTERIAILTAGLEAIKTLCDTIPKEVSEADLRAGYDRIWAEAAKALGPRQETGALQ